MGLRDWWYHHHHKPAHHTNRVDAFIAPDGHAVAEQSTHCDKRNCHTDGKHGVGPEPGNPWHGKRTEAVSEFHPHPPGYEPVQVPFPIPTPGPVIFTRPMAPCPPPPSVVVSETTVTRSCPGPVVSTIYGPWRPVERDCSSLPVPKPSQQLPQPMPVPGFKR